MLTSSTLRSPRRTLASTVLGLLLVGSAASPAVAGSIRDQQWYLDAMKAGQMWQTSTGKGVTVAVIDSGVDWQNGDLKGQVLPGKDLSGGQPGDEHTDPDGHGTGMAGLIAGTGRSGGGDGAYGLAPGAKILPIRTSLRSSGDSAVKEWPEAIRYAVDAHAKVINISEAGYAGSQELTDAAAYALKKGALIFAGVGNDADKGNAVQYPAATPGVVGVAAVGKDLHRAPFSEHGPQVDMAAPGVDMVHACGGKTGLCKTSGTSDATALASASAALIWSAHPEWTNNQVLRVMLNTIGGPTDGKERNDSIGYGIVRPRIALTDPGDPGPADKYPLPDLAAAASATPTPSAAAADPKGQGRATDPDRSGGEASAAHHDSSTTILWLTVAVLAAVAVALSVAVAIRRRSVWRA